MILNDIRKNPERKQWAELTARCTTQNNEINASVEAIMNEVRTGGDEALRAITRRIDRAELSALELSPKEREEAIHAIPESLKAAIATAAEHIERFHSAQLPRPVEVETMPGVKCVQRAVPIQRVGLYIPGGKAPLFSTVLMLALPARIAGCPEVILCTPCDAEGKVSPEIIYTANLCGIRRIFRVGGAQAIAAMAYGTESIPRVDKIFGPGNRYVTRAKQLVSMDTVAIDMPAGPSEVLVLADETADAAFVAADLLSQAEHGSDSQVVLVTTSETLAAEVQREVEEQAAQLSRGKLLHDSLRNSRILYFDRTSEAISFANAYAPEHLIIAMREGWEVAARITAAGSVFIGNYSPESAGDYASGTNHTLPTSGWARAYNGVNTESFMRKITYQELTPEGLKALSPTILAMARAEGLDAHAAAVTVRMKGGRK